MLHSLSHLYKLQQFFSPLATLSLRKARIEHGKLYISKSIGLRDQIVCLEDESDLLVTDHGQIRIAGAFHINAV